MRLFLLLGFIHIAKHLTGLSSLGTVQLNTPEPLGFSKIKDKLGVSCLFEQNIIFGFFQKNI